MSCLVWKTDDFILNRWTISGPNAFDDSAIERRPIEAAFNDFVGGGIRISDMAGDLIRFDLFCCEGERDRRLIPVLRCQLREVNRPAVESRSGPGLEPPHSKAQFFYGF